VPATQPLSVHPFLDKIRAILPSDVTVHLVGGAVRDAILGRPVHDLDFILPRGALRVARQIADSLGGAYYPLDEERETGRVVVVVSGDRKIMDFAVYQGSDMENDLLGRDFTVNAMAMDIHPPYALLDPLGGIMDLRHKRLRACSATAFEKDPVRILRGIRMASDHNFHILSDTRKYMRQAAHLIPGVSIERIRDELFRILDGKHPDASLRALEILGAMAHILPELLALKGLEQPPPHILDAWNHSLDLVRKLETVLNVLDLEHDPEASAGWHLGLLVLRLGRYREYLHAHLNKPLNINRSQRSLLILAGLYHDTGKAETKGVDKDGRVHFYEHEHVSARLVSERARNLHLSSAEINLLSTIVKHHMRPLWLAQTGKPPSEKAIYRFFRDTKEAGVDICLLSLADTLATYGPTLPQDNWVHHLDVVRKLLQAWWENPDERISPPALISGHDLIDELALKPGPQIGQILESVREAQASNQIRTREEALDLARELHEASEVSQNNT
jgi:poly(A) polymerase